MPNKKLKATYITCNKSKKLAKARVNQAQEEFDEEIRQRSLELRREQAVKRPRLHATAPNCQDDDFGAEYGGCDDFRHTKKSKKDTRRLLDKWEDYGRALVNFYMEALATGQPSIALTNPQQLPDCCGCKKSTKIVTLYMLLGKYVIFTIINLFMTFFK